MAAFCTAAKSPSAAAAGEGGHCVASYRRITSPQHITRQHTLHLIDAELLIELLLYRHSRPRNPDLEFRIEIEGASRLHTEVRDALVGNGVVVDLAPRHALLVDQHEALVGEHEVVADELVGVLDHFALRQDLAELLLDLRRVDLGCVAKHSIK